MNELKKRIQKSYHEGSLRSWMVTTICLIVVSAGLTVLSAWSYINYRDQKDNVDDKIAAAVTDAKKTQADNDAAKYQEAEKKPYASFSGPSDFGTVTFKYPKTWDLYVADDGSSSDSYEAYLNPSAVPTVNDKQIFALRVSIESKSYSSVIDDYDSDVQDGTLTSSSIKVNGVTGTKLAGNFSDDIRGYAVIFKIRDKTLTIRTDAETFKNDFDTLVQTIKFNQ